MAKKLSESTSSVHPKGLSSSCESGFFRKPSLGKVLPYKFGGKSRIGVDCSGFITNVFIDAVRDQRLKPEMHNIAKLRTGRMFETVSKPTNGDLVLWKGHGGIDYYTGAGAFIGAQSSTGVAIAS